jgi:hypothetical protein
MLILYFYLHFFPLFISILYHLYLTSLEPRTSDRVLILDEVFVDEPDQVHDLVEVFFPEPTRSSISVEGFLKELNSYSSSCFVSSPRSTALLSASVSRRCGKVWSALSILFSPSL